MRRSTKTRPAPLSTADRDRLVLEKMEMARRTACNFRLVGKYPIELEELEAEAYLALSEASRSYDPETTPLPWGAYASQRVVWRLIDFMQSWYRLSRVDYTSGRPGARRQLPLSAGEAARSVLDDDDPSHGLVLEDAARLVREILDPRERRIIALRYEAGKNLKEIAALIGITHLRCRQIHCDAMRTLRGVMNGDARASKYRHRAMAG